MPKRLSQLYQEELQRVTGSSSNYRSDLRVARYGDGRKSIETNALNAISTNQQNKDLDTYAEYEAASGLTEKYALSEGKRHLYEQGFYGLQDRFTTDVAAGSVNGSSALPTGGARVVTDTNTKISVTGNTISFATGEAANDGVWYSTFTRTAGRACLLSMTETSGSGGGGGWDTNTSGAPAEAIRLDITNLLKVLRAGTALTVWTYTTGGTYLLCTILRANGAYEFIKGGVEFPNWTMIWADVAANNTPMRPVVNATATTSVFTATNIRVPRALWLPTPIAYDTFTRANGGLGSTENVGGDGQVAPILAWTSTLGTWAVATNVAAASATSGGSAFATVNSPKADIVIDANLTRVAGVAGVVLRYANSTNYIIAYHDGTNVNLDKVIGGSTTNILTAVQAYSAGATLRVIASGSTFRLFYNNVAIGGAGTIADAAVQATTVHGLYTTDTGATFDNFQIFPRGTSNEYSSLDFL